MTLEELESAFIRLFCSSMATNALVDALLMTHPDPVSARAAVQQHVAKLRTSTSFELAKLGDMDEFSKSMTGAWEGVLGRATTYLGR